MSNMSDDATYVVETKHGEAQGLIFHPGDTLIIRMTTEAFADYSNQELSDLINTVRQTVGEQIEVVLLDSNMEVHKAVRMNQDTKE